MNVYMDLTDATSMGTVKILTAHTLVHVIKVIVDTIALVSNNYL